MKIHVVNNQVEGATVALDILREKIERRYQGIRFGNRLQSVRILQIDS